MSSSTDWPKLIPDDHGLSGAADRMRICVAIPTVGRPDTVASVVSNLKQQTRLPDGVIVIGAHHSDVEAVDHLVPFARTIISERGLCKQRNAALSAVAADADIVVFFDDDFVPDVNYLAEAEKLLTSEAEVVGATGWLFADGAIGAGIPFDEAVSMMNTYSKDSLPADKPAEALYGCNMVLRASALSGLRFDESLPLYGWLEDIDFTYQLGRRGRLVRTRDLSGVHMGIKSGRTSGRRLGYSQVANPFYLLRKGSAPRKLLGRLVLQNLTSNLLRSFCPESSVDRRGRLYGNMRAILDILRLKIDPQRAVEL